MQNAHDLFFTFDSPLSGPIKKLCQWADRYPFMHLLLETGEDGAKKMLLGCRKCGDCAIVHVAFLCPESQCPKHIRNGACGGSHNGMCEVCPDRRCIWFRAYNRLAAADRENEMAAGCIPPRMWELDRTSSWINFHLGRDHQSAASEITRFCSTVSCALSPEWENGNKKT